MLLEDTASLCRSVVQNARPEITGAMTNWATTEKDWEANLHKIHRYPVFLFTPTTILSVCNTTLHTALL